jgi:hypothetical protein
MDVKKVKEELVGAGIEVYRTRATEVCVAERVRFHIMDSGIRVVVDGALKVSFTARSQRSDFPPETSDDDLFARVRGLIGESAVERGYAESWAGTTPVKDPLDDARVLDVYHEVTYTKRADSPAEAVDEVRWALSQERYVAPDKPAADTSSGE